MMDEVKLVSCWYSSWNIHLYSFNLCGFYNDLIGVIFGYRSYDYKSHKDIMWAIRTELNVFTWLVNVQLSTFIILIDASGNRVAVC